MRLGMRPYVALILFLPLVAFAYTSPGRPTGFVNDFGQMITAETRDQLEQELTLFNAQTKHEVAVVTIGSLENEPIEYYAEKLFSEWAIGKEKADNGVLFLISRDERQLRIEVGYGLEGALTDLQSKQIIDKVVVPLFQAGDFDGGIREGVRAITATIAGEVIPVLDDINNSLYSGYQVIYPYLAFGFWFFFQVILGLFAKTKTWWLGGVVGAIVGAIFGFGTLSLTKGVIATIILLPLGLLIDYLASKYGTHFRHGSGLGGGGRWGGGGGFGGFGGGGSGGGGASGRW